MAFFLAAKSHGCPLSHGRGARSEAEELVFSTGVPFSSDLPCLKEDLSQEISTAVVTRSRSLVMAVAAGRRSITSS